MKIDYVELTKQEPVIKDFVSGVLFEIMANDKSGEDMIKTIYNFYQLGMDINQVTKFFKNMKND